MLDGSILVCAPFHYLRGVLAISFALLSPLLVKMELFELKNSLNGALAFREKRW